MRVMVSCIILLAGCFSQVFSQENTNSGFLLGAVARLERLHDAAIQEVQFYSNEIRKADITIQKSESILQRAKEQNNAEAERIAQNAIALAKSAKEKNLLAKSAAEIKLLQIEFSLNTARNEFKDPISGMENYEAIVSAYTGRTTVQKSDGTTFTVDKSRPLFLRKGDLVTTNDYGGLELQTLGGRGNIRLSENTKIEIGDNSDAGIEFIKLFKGKIKVAVEKLEIFEKDLEKMVKSYEEDLKSVNDELKARIVKEYKERKANILKYRNKFEVRCPYGTGAIRSTRFSVTTDDFGNVEFIVTEGIVELRSTKSRQKVELKAGEKAVILKDGTISKPEKAGG